MLSAQFKIEGLGFFPCVRDAPLPFGDAMEPYILVRNLPDDVIRRCGRYIFNRTIDYLKTLAVQNLYPKGTLENMVGVLLSDSGNDEKEVVSV